MTHTHIYILFSEMILTGLDYFFHMPMPHLFSAVSVTDSEEKYKVRTGLRTPKTLLRCNAFMHATLFLIFRLLSTATGYPL